MKKIALCFIISYKHVLNKEQLWKDWIEPNKDIINVYFHYKNYSLISSPWIRQHCIPIDKLCPTSYFHVSGAYMSLLSYAFSHDIQNTWFCLLTESCVPIIHPDKFRYLFLHTYHASLFQWKPAYWNIDFHRRANLHLLHKKYHLANTPWFVFTRQHVHKSILFMVKKNNIYQQICKGGLANESLFAIVLETFDELQNSYTVINSSSTLMDWRRMSNATSPHLFKEGSEEDISFIMEELEKNKYALFLRKVDPEFPEDILNHIIYHTDFAHTYYDKMGTNTNENTVPYSWFYYVGIMFLLAGVYGLTYILFMVIFYYLEGLLD